MVLNVLASAAALAMGAVLAVAASAQETRGPAQPDPTPISDPNLREGPVTDDATLTRRRQIPLSDPSQLPTSLHLAVFHFDDYEDWLAHLDTDTEADASAANSFASGAWNRNFLSFDALNPHNETQKVRVMALRANGDVATRRDRSLSPGATREVARIHPEPGVTDLKTFVLISRKPIMTFGTASRDRFSAGTFVYEDIGYGRARQMGALTELTPRLIDCGSAQYVDAPWLCRTAAEDWGETLQIGEDYFVD